MRNRPQPRASSSPRRGVAYIIVLGATSIVACVALGGLLAVRAQARNVDSYARVAAAREYALTAVELAVQETASDPNWRTTHKNDAGGMWYQNRAFGSGAFSLKVVNPSGDLDREPTDPVVLTATGTFTNSYERQIVETTLIPQITPLTCLQTALCSNSLVYFPSSTVEGRNMIVASNSTGLAILATGPMYTRLEAVGSIFSFSGNDGTATGVTPRTTPVPDTAFDYYIAKGTPISLSSLTYNGSNRELSRVVLSPQSNPYGGVTNEKGIYVIDCGGATITIRRMRLVGTLVLLNPGSGSAIEDEVLMEPAVANLPTLLVRGSLTFDLTSSTLAESSFNGNFNPAGTPYPWIGGGSDGDTADTYPNIIYGLAYLSGSAYIDGPLKLGMLMVDGACSTNSGSSLTLSYSPTYYSNPPPGFYTIKMIPSPGTWRPLTD